jgi:nucleoside phosphorylase
MVFVFMALYPEAKPVIKRFGLKKRTDRTRFQEFVSEGEDIVLAITGVGPVAAAAAVAAVLTEYDAGPGDQLLSVGTAAALNSEYGPVGKPEAFCEEGGASVKLTEAGYSSGIFLLNKLLDQNSDRTFYPDMLLKTDMREASGITGSTVLSQRAAAFMKVAAEGYDLYDMESAAVYQAGNIFMGPHQMSFIRVVSDRGIETEDRKQVVSDGGVENEDQERVVPDGSIGTEAGMVVPKASESAASYVYDMAAKVNAVINSHVEDIAGYVEKLLLLSENGKRPGGISDKTGENLVDKIPEDGHFSKVMHDQLRQYVRYADLSGIDWENTALMLYDEGVLPTIDKRGGKKALDRIKSCIMN